MYQWNLEPGFLCDHSGNRYDESGSKTALEWKAEAWIK